MNLELVPKSRRDWAKFADVLPDFADREIVPSVSQAIAWKHGGPPQGIAAVEESLDRGSKVHRALHFRDKGTLDMATVKGHVQLLGYMDQWAKFLEASDQFVCLEEPLWGTVSGVDYIVRPDRVLERNGRIIIVDIKTKGPKGRGPGKDEQLKHGLEVAAQRIAVAQRLGPDAHWVGCLYIWPDKRQAVGYNDAKYMDQWGALLGEWAERNRDMEASAVGA